jgi:tRNA pseudouridine32 synthase/23S rRNA pseudouridine746 synthase/23S rRNA pseudouridine1911/1915/1917 synthase
VKIFSESSRTTIRSWIEHERITLNGKKAHRAKTPVAKGDIVELLPKPLPKEGPLKIHYEDEHVIVVDKPAGLLSVAKDTGKGISAHAYVKRHVPGKKVFVIHRLDQETSGLLVFALSQQAFHKLKEELKQRKVQRTYVAIVEGGLEGEGVWDCYVVEDRSLKMRTVPKGSVGAERAITKYKVLRSGVKTSLIECHLVTGKKNQIRIQAAVAGHPIIGDTKYGAPHSHAPRMCLHASTLSFLHPITRKELLFKSPHHFT